MSSRKTYFLGFVVVSCLLLFSFYLQYFDGFVPCPLCTLQRFAFIGLAFLFLLGAILHFKSMGRIIINSLLLITSIAGIALAGRQVWIQNFPSAAGDECGVSLQYMIKVLPLHEVLQKTFQGTTECTQQGSWEFLNFNMAEWSLIWFCLFLLFTLFLFLKEFNHNHHHYTTQ